MANNKRTRAIALAVAAALASVSTTTPTAQAQEYINRTVDAVKHIPRGSTPVAGMSEEMFNVDAIESGEVTQVSQLAELDHVVYGRITDAGQYSSGHFIYFRWVDRDGQVSPLYTARAHDLEGAPGYYAIAVPDWVDATGRIHKFTAASNQQVQLDAYVPYRHQEHVLAGDQTTAYAYFTPSSREVDLRILSGGAFTTSSEALIAEFGSTQLPARAGQTAHGLSWWNGTAASLKDYAYGNESISYRWNNETTGRIVSSCDEERTVINADETESVVQLTDAERNRCTTLQIPSTAKRGDVYSFEVLADGTVVSHESFIVTGDLNERDDYLFDDERLLSKDARVLSFGRFRDGFNRAETEFAPRAVPGIDINVEDGTLYVGTNADLGNDTPDIFDATVDVSFYNSDGSRPATQPILLDMDGDGNADAFDPDDDGDGVLDTIEVADGSNKKHELNANTVISANLPEALQGQQYSARIDADKLPRDAQLELVSDIPGVTYDPISGALEGTPTQPGTYPVTFRAAFWTQPVTNSTGEVVEQTVGDLVVKQAHVTTTATTTARTTTTAPTPTSYAKVTATTTTREVTGPTLTVAPTLTTAVTPVPTTVTPAPTTTTAVATTTLTNFDRPDVRAGGSVLISVSRQLAPNANTPDWVSIDPDGAVTVTPPADISPGEYDVEVQFADGTPAIIPIRVTASPISAHYDVALGRRGHEVRSFAPLFDITERGFRYTRQPAPAGTRFEALDAGTRVDEHGRVTFTIPRDAAVGEVVDTRIRITVGEESFVVPARFEVAAQTLADDTTPHYTDGVTAGPGQRVTVPLTGADNAEFYLKPGQDLRGWEIIVDPDTGELRATAPADAEPVDVAVVAVYSDGSRDTVTVRLGVSDAASDAAEAEPAFEAKVAGPGDTVRVPQTKPLPDGTVFALADDAGLIVDIHPHTGELSVQLPDDAPADAEYTVSVRTTYPDGTTEVVPVTVGVASIARTSTLAYPQDATTPTGVPAGTTFALAPSYADNAWLVDVDKRTGKITATPRADARTTVVPVQVTYADGSKRTVHVRVSTTPATTSTSSLSSETPWWIYLLLALLATAGIGWAVTENQDEIRKVIPQFPVLPRL